MINRAQIKAEAKSLVRTGRASPILVTAVILVIQEVLNRVSNLVSYGTLFPESADINVVMDLLQQGVTDPQVMMDAVYASGAVANSGTFFSILVSLFVTVLLGGYLSYLMGIRQRLETPYSTLMDGLGVAGKLIWCDIQVFVRVFLWSMLFVIPGVIAGYRYRFAMYNLLTDDSLSASEAIALSCQQTKGMKMDLFVLDLSFLGWNFLVTLTMGLLSLWVMPYANLCDLAYFEEAQRRLGRVPYGRTDPFDQNSDPWNL